MQNKKITTFRGMGLRASLLLLLLSLSLSVRSLSLLSLLDRALANRAALLRL